MVSFSALRGQNQWLQGVLHRTLPAPYHDQCSYSSTPLPARSARSVGCQGWLRRPEGPAERHGQSRPGTGSNEMLVAPASLAGGADWASLRALRQRCLCTGIFALAPPSYVFPHSHTSDVAVLAYIWTGKPCKTDPGNILLRGFLFSVAHSNSYPSRLSSASLSPKHSTHAIYIRTTPPTSLLFTSQRPWSLKSHRAHHPPSVRSLHDAITARIRPNLVVSFF